MRVSVATVVVLLLPLLLLQAMCLAGLLLLHLLGKALQLTGCSCAMRDWYTRGMFELFVVVDIAMVTKGAQGGATQLLQHLVTLQVAACSCEGRLNKPNWSSVKRCTHINGAGWQLTPRPARQR